MFGLRVLVGWNGLNPDGPMFGSGLSGMGSTRVRIFSSDASSSYSSKSMGPCGLSWVVRGWASDGAVLASDAGSTAAGDGADAGLGERRRIPSSEPPGAANGAGSAAVGDGANVWHHER